MMGIGEVTVWYIGYEVPSLAPEVCSRNFLDVLTEDS